MAGTTQISRPPPSRPEGLPAGRAMLQADWDDALFIHWAVSPQRLQDRVPFELDAFGGQAFVSLVAFTQRRLRPRIGGRLTAVLSTPLACHPFLNLRTYVLDKGKPAIFFMAEWIPNRLAAFMGPVLYGLPYRLAKLDYHDSPGRSSRQVRADREFRAAAVYEPRRPLMPATPGTRDAFLLERYCALTARRGIQRRFRIRHRPWRMAPASISFDDTSLLDEWPELFSHAARAGAHYSPGLKDVEIGRPETLS